jgi:DNA-binding transcriptional LysR family regulator
VSSWTQLADQQWIDAPDAGVCLNDDAETGLAYQDDDFGAVLAMVAAGLGVAVLPLLALATVPGQARRRPPVVRAFPQCAATSLSLGSPSSA